MEIHAAGGGIHYTVQKTKEASEETLVEKMLARLDQMISQGTLTIEAKSGYGLEVMIVTVLFNASFVILAIC